MNKALLSILLLLIALLPAAAAAETPRFWLGGDISGTTELEAAGISTCNADGVATETTRLMRDLGMNAVRLRVWVNPRGGFCSPTDVLEMARRAKDCGMAIMIDFHYSDWWADPGKQNIPKAWEGLSYEEMKGALAAHTAETLLLLKENGIDVKWVQVGNETTNGFLWPVGRIEDNFSQYAGLTKAGYEAVKRVYPDAAVIVHLDNGYSRELYDWVFSRLKEEGTPWDIIGISVYPYWSKRDQLDPSAVSDIIDNIHHLRDTYGTEVMIVETGVEVAHPEDGKTFLSNLINSAIDSDGACTGVFYWAPEASDGPYPLGAFSNNRPTVIMDAFTQAAERLKNENRY